MIKNEKVRTKQENSYYRYLLWRCPFVLYVGKKKLVKRKEFEKFITDNIEI